MLKLRKRKNGRMFAYEMMQWPFRNCFKVSMVQPVQENVYIRFVVTVENTTDMDERSSYCQNNDVHISFIFLFQDFYKHK
jgi:hypothetical protein